MTTLIVRVISRLMAAGYTAEHAYTVADAFVNGPTDHLTDSERATLMSLVNKEV